MVVSTPPVWESRQCQTTGTVGRVSSKMCFRHLKEGPPKIFNISQSVHCSFLWHYIFSAVNNTHTTHTYLSQSPPGLHLQRFFRLYPRGHKGILLSPRSPAFHHCCHNRWFFFFHKRLKQGPKQLIRSIIQCAACVGIWKLYSWEYVGPKGSAAW